ncbi:MAG: hypothetical protein GWN73_19485 [Actinobacteria bacterium]|nr:hypothetical protein [Actinomycetota bacterium]NIU67483.1 hypothetical protein [Actinomycetota bacterium]
MFRSFNHLAAATSIALLLLPLGSPAVAGTRIEKSVALASGGSFELDTDVGSVTVEGSSRDGVQLVIMSRNDDLLDKFELSIDEDADGVSVQFERKGSRSSWKWGRGDELKFAIQVPHQTRLDIDTSGGSIMVDSIDDEVRLDTSGGSIVARGIGGELEADTSGGSIQIEDVDGDVVADTSGGSITVEDVRGSVSADTSGGSIVVRNADGDVDADTSGGSIAISRAGGRVNADTSGGSIAVSFTAGNSAGGSMATSGGGIEINIDPSADLDIDAQASGGSVITNLPLNVQGKISRTTLKGRLNGGGETLRLRASGGKIRIEPL